jgi:hypothetical protein
MGAIKNKMLEEMDDEDHTDEYGGFMDNDETDLDEDQVIEDQMIQKAIDAIEEQEIERQIKEQEKKNG